MHICITYSNCFTNNSPLKVYIKIGFICLSNKYSESLRVNLIIILDFREFHFWHWSEFSFFNPWIIYDFYWLIWGFFLIYIGWFQGRFWRFLLVDLRDLLDFYWLIWGFFLISIGWSEGSSWFLLVDLRVFLDFYWLIWGFFWHGPLRSHKADTVS